MPRLGYKGPLRPPVVGRPSLSIRRNGMCIRSLWLRSLAIVLLATTAISARQSTSPAPELYNRLHWRTIGPEGNRFSAAAGVPGDPYTYYVGAASGGIFKTTDGGVNWAAIFDDQPVQSIGAL